MRAFAMGLGPMAAVPVAKQGAFLAKLSVSFGTSAGLLSAPI
jgi:hypothetical protein